MIAGHYVIPEVNCLYYLVNFTISLSDILKYESMDYRKDFIYLLSLISLKVTLFFHGKLYRGNRALKVDARRFGAFDSPNCPPLATVEAGIEGKIEETGESTFLISN